MCNIYVTSDAVDYGDFSGMNYRNDELLEKLGARIKELREKKGMSQVDLAAECDIERMQIYRIELGKVNTTVSTLELIGKALHMTPSELLKDL